MCRTSILCLFSNTSISKTISMNYLCGCLHNPLINPHDSLDERVCKLASHLCKILNGFLWFTQTDPCNCRSSEINPWNCQRSKLQQLLGWFTHIEAGRRHGRWRRSPTILRMNRFLLKDICTLPMVVNGQNLGHHVWDKGLKDSLHWRF